MSITHVYCDESGFTGNRMLDLQQPYFTYSAVTVDPAEASEFVTSIMRDFGVQGGELKFEKLVKFNRGRSAITKIIDWLDGRYLAVFYHKKYNLACKFFEYIFEPVLQENNSLFYKKNFHRHISNCLYMHFESRMAGAEEIMQDFENFMRTRDIDGLSSLFSTSSRNPDVGDAINAMLDFAIGYQEQIRNEIGSLVGSDGVGKWVLDVTISSLFSLLSNLGQKHDVIEVYCDKSKPLESDSALFNAMINRPERRYMYFSGKKRPLTWNMSKPLELVDSKPHPAIQLADSISGALCYSLKRNDDKICQEWFERLMPNLHDDCVYPDLSSADLATREAFANAIVLLELSTRAKNGNDPLYGMEEFYQIVEHRLATNPPSFVRG